MTYVPTASLRLQVSAKHAARMIVKIISSRPRSKRRWWPCVKSMGPKCVVTSSCSPVGASTAIQVPGGALAPRWSWTLAQPARPNIQPMGKTDRTRSANGKMGCGLLRRRGRPSSISKYFHSTMPVKAPMKPPNELRPVQSVKSDQGAFFSSSK